MYQQRQGMGNALHGASGDVEKFVSAAGFAKHVRVLSLGEQDYSFSRRIAELQHQAGNPVQLVASSYLAEHDPSETEVHVNDDAIRFQYTRRSLPDMGGTLFGNISAIKAVGGDVLHSVDATDLTTTLLSQTGPAEFDIIVFPFPRFSLKRSVDPGNSKLLRGFFQSVNKAGVLAQGGVAQLLLLGTQYAEWDTACMAMEAGFELQGSTPLPPHFYQSREMSGKAWTPLNGYLYSFTHIGSRPSVLPAQGPGKGISDPAV
jgi:hypothetical protein